LLASALERMGTAPRFSVEVCAAASASPVRVLDVLARAGELAGTSAAVELLAVEPSAARYRVSATCASPRGRSALLVASLEALTDAGLVPGRESDERK
jgi:hypothetical protein